jgi:hypothetical protein
MIRIRCTAVLALGLPFGALSAQDTPALAPGARVRVTAPAPDCEHPDMRFCPRRQVVGTLTTIDSQRITLRDEHGATLDIARGPGTRLDLSAGPGACGVHRGHCVGLGFLGGAAVGALVGFAWLRSQGTSCNDSPCGVILLITTPGGAFLGAAVGGLLGSEHWHTVDAPVRVGFGPDGSRRFALRLSVRF